MTDDDPSEMLIVSYQADSDGTGKLKVAAATHGFSGVSAAWFDTENLKEFAKSISAYPLPEDDHPIIQGGFGSDIRMSAPPQEHVRVEVGPVGGKGQVAVWVHLATEIWRDTRPGQFYEVRLKLLTTYERLRMFSSHFLRVLEGDLAEATIGSEALKLLCQAASRRLSEFLVLVSKSRVIRR